MVLSTVYVGGPDGFAGPRRRDGRCGRPHQRTSEVEAACDVADIALQLTSRAGMALGAGGFWTPTASAVAAGAGVSALSRAPRSFKARSAASLPLRASSSRATASRACASASSRCCAARRACRASTVSVLGSGSACVVTARCVLPCTMRLMTVVCASYAATR